MVNLLQGEGPRSRLWWIEIPLHSLMLFGMWRLARDLPFYLPLTRYTAPWAYAIASWAFGMVYEASLTLDGAGIGGMHPDTRSSFLLAQGDYVLVAITGLALIRWFRLDFREAFFLAGGISLSEGLVYTGILTTVLLSPAFWAAPAVLAYYTMVYASFVALPLLFIDPALLWRGGERTRRPAILYLWVAGFMLGFLIRMVWGLGWAPLATRQFELPPNLPGI